MGTNDIQIGGDHYKNKLYQHWDWVCDINLHYLLACCTKYVARWREKNGVQDLRKSLHYLDKAEDRNIYPELEIPYTVEFCNQLNTDDGDIIKCIMMSDYSVAKTIITNLIAEACECEANADANPDSSYVDQG